MRNAIFGFLIGALLVVILAVFFGGTFGADAKQRLIDDWRKILPGMTLDEVKSELGEPSGQFPVAQGFPEWAERSVPNDFSRNH
jgi:hypothetical protein